MITSSSFQCNEFFFESNFPNPTYINTQKLYRDIGIRVYVIQFPFLLNPTTEIRWHNVVSELSTGSKQCRTHWSSVVPTDTICTSTGWNFSAKIHLLLRCSYIHNSTHRSHSRPGNIFGIVYPDMVTGMQ